MAFVGSGPRTPASTRESTPRTPPTMHAPTAPPPVLRNPLPEIRCPRIKMTPGFFQHDTDDLLRKYSFFAALRAAAVLTGDYRAAYVIDERMKVVDSHVSARIGLMAHFKALVEEERCIMMW